MREWRIESFDEDGEPHATLASDLRSVLRLGLAAVLIVAASVPSVSRVAAPTSGAIGLGGRHVEQPPPPPDRLMVISRDTIITPDPITCRRTANSSYRGATRIPVIPELRTGCLSKARGEGRITTLTEMHPAKVWSAGLVTLSTDSPGRVFVVIDPMTGQLRAYIGQGD